MDTYLQDSHVIYILMNAYVKMLLIALFLLNIICSVQCIVLLKMFTDDWFFSIRVIFLHLYFSGELMGAYQISYKLHHYHGHYHCKLYIMIQ